MNNFLEKLNSEQASAVTTNAKYVRVIAGAGSGKTRVLTSRIAYLIGEVGILPERILAFTFTNKAAKEMKDRVNIFLDGKIIKSNISTFHSYCARFLRKEIAHLKYTRNFVILDEQDQKDIIKELKKPFDENKDVKSEEIINYISYMKCAFISPKQALSYIEHDNKYERNLIKANTYKAYEEYNYEHNYLDFDDLILKTLEILNKFEHIREKYQNSYDYILVDEYQDTDNLEYMLIKLLAGKNNSVYVVGDPDQTIYSWRGADIKIILNFSRDFAPSKDYYLKENYRSTKAILDCANSLISNNKNRLEKDLFTNSKEGKKPICYEGTNQENEADWIANQIKNQMEKYGYKYKDFAILYRSNYYSSFIEKSLLKLGLPYEIYGAIKFYQRKEIKDIVAYLRLIINETDDLAFSRIINVPSRKIGKKTLEKIVSGSKEEGKNFYQYIKDNFSDDESNIAIFVSLIEKYKVLLKKENYPNYGKIVRDLLDESGYMNSLDYIEDEDRIENLREFGDILFNHQLQNSDITMEEILEEIALYSSQDSVKDDNKISLMTVHVAKGLEFENVFVAGLCEYVFPSSKSINGLDASNKVLEEERRLCYVAFTRAKQNLFLSYERGYSYSAQAELTKSRFLREVEDRIEYTLVPYYKNYDAYSKTKSIDTKPIISTATLSNKPSDFRPGDVIIHNNFGEGIIIEVQEKSYQVAFKNRDIGNKVISRSFSGMHKKEG